MESGRIKFNNARTIFSLNLASICPSFYSYFYNNNKMLGNVDEIGSIKMKQNKSPSVTLSRIIFYERVTKKLRMINIEWRVYYKINSTRWLMR